MVMFKKIKSFEVVFNDPEKVYGSGEKVAGRVIVEVCEVTRVKAVYLPVGKCQEPPFIFYSHFTEKD